MLQPLEALQRITRTLTAKITLAIPQIIRLRATRIAPMNLETPSAANAWYAKAITNTAGLRIWRTV